MNKQEKVIKVSREFDEWVQKAKTAYCSADLWKEWCIYQINQMGWGQWLQVPVACKDIEDSYGHHPEWTREIHGNKELHTRAILDGYEVENEQLYYVKLPGVGYLNNADGGIKHTEKEIKVIDKRYWPFAVKVFNGDFNNWMGFNKQKYTREQAIEEWRSELMLEENTPYIVEDAFVRYRFGVDEDNENRSCWWLEWRDCGHRSVPVWSIRTPFPWELEGAE
ncbi:DUF1642 domain-containing protein [Enterococcus faecalis]|uniref:DUF1642 domain-containing protein n=2 Tax=Enterococcus faecalis TaxID=1351 RepID=UPI003D2C8454